MSSYVQGVLKYQTQALVEMALNTSTPEVGPDWLDMIASNLRTDPVTSKAGGEGWIAKLDPPTRERLGPELQRRLSPADWSRVQSHFQMCDDSGGSYRECLSQKQIGTWQVFRFIRRHAAFPDCFL
jgi:hypothetical protein